jgi:hypothetical protein
VNECRDCSTLPDSARGERLTVLSILRVLNPFQRNFIRIVYVLVILVLAGFGVHTWRQLQSLRTAPVALPNFWFYVVGEPGRMTIQTHGTWLVTDGPPLRDRLQTSTLECHQARMQCMASTAVVSMHGGSFLESFPRNYEIETWNEREIITKPVMTDCSSHVVTLNLVDRGVSAVTSLLPDKSDCKEVARKLKLDNGSKAREQSNGKK